MGQPAAVGRSVVVEGRTAMEVAAAKTAAEAARMAVEAARTMKTEMAWQQKFLRRLWKSGIVKY